MLRKHDFLLAIALEYKISDYPLPIIESSILAKNPVIGMIDHRCIRV
ncbi:hypothetical protein [Candidatus Enterococcus murrayae]|uniref:Uncharacterized protein n=1 Tax=Candidatus Enterococcus murrayae TaxID=2815321 RepID=A0ABS3HHS5_9ENTE|nr:hypothetical protein [Enterococcus sp. MJM16]MBO0452489.1 hypothetical protein [Enterococcus sp. MJM16]